MEITRVTKVYLTTTDGHEMVVGNRYVFSDGEKSCIGEYIGISKRGAVEFENVLDGTKFAVMPKSIKSCYKSNVIIGKVD